jgi:hypothetical protein
MHWYIPRGLLANIKLFVQFFMYRETEESDSESETETDAESDMIDGENGYGTTSQGTGIA